jgi:membrane protein YqaA with SNARE-associated domain
VLASTILPVRSEVFQFGMSLGPHSRRERRQHSQSGRELVARARFVDHFRDRRWFPVGRDRIAGAEDCTAARDAGSLLAAWLPFLGDPLILLVGVMRERLATFIRSSGSQWWSLMSPSRA